MAFSWRCPFCAQNATITDENYSRGVHTFGNGNKYGGQSLRFWVVVCPNSDCRQYELGVSLHNRILSGTTWKDEEAKQRWTLIPAAAVQVFPDYVPEAILADYREAALIKDLSPKASATLARRCLQGMIRDYWKVKPGRLFDEINALKDRMDPLTWNAIDAVRQLGNIGAHMQEDINVIVDVDPGEAALLIGLIETLTKEWYVAAHERTASMVAIISAASAKRPAATPPASSP